MPRRDDIHKILLLGSGPIVIGQAAEFDYSGTQACRVLVQEGYEVVLVNSNPATIMTDPEVATTTYVEPLLPGPVAQVIARERPDALLPTLGGQTALNLAKALHEDGTLERYGVELIGADYEAIDRAEDRERFRDTMTAAGLRVPRSAIAHNLDDAHAAVPEIGLPFIVRPAFTLGGSGGGVVRTEAEIERVVGGGLAASPIGQVLLEESVLGWGEFELEVMRDHTDNVVIVCSIENLDPMGVHTGDSVCVAPQQTLTDKQYQALRDQAIAVIRAVGVETGGSNVQFAVNSATDEIVVIEMNPRVSRSSALASKATGFPIAKIAARLAVGYTLQEIPNDITRATPASFEPAIDYCVVKWPRFAFEKFPGAEPGLTTHMKSVGEAMALGRTFKQAFAKALRSRELDTLPVSPADDGALLDLCEMPGAERWDHVLEALRRRLGVEQLHARTSIDPWFLRELEELAADPDAVWTGARTFKAVDTCAAEFAARTPYFYSGWERPGPDGPRHEAQPGERPGIVILGSGPNRIGQGIEFDYCCVHAAQTVRELGRDAVMINCNPETVSTDYDTSDRLYFEPLTLEDVVAVCELEQPEGVVVQFGGQTPLKLAAGLEAAGIPILGTGIEAIDLAEDRGRFGALLDSLGYRAPPYATADSAEQALQRAQQVGFPLLVRPSYVLGGRAMEIVYSVDGLRDYLRRVGVQSGATIYLDRFLEDSIEVDVDALCDGHEVWIAGIMQHVEEAGIHSGDSACVLPPHALGDQMLNQIREQTTGLARALGVVGLLNVQFAIHREEGLHVIEANPRASRTVPFVSKAIGLPLAKLACRIMLGERVSELDLPDEPMTGHVCVKEAVLPFNRFAGADSLLGPEMRSTGEVMGIAPDFPTAFAKAQAAAGAGLPSGGTVFLTVADADKPAATGIATQLHDLGFEIVATRGTAEALRRMGIPSQEINKIGEGSPHVVDWIERGAVDLVINTPVGTGARSDGWEIRSAAVTRGIPCITTMAGGMAAARAIAAGRRGEPQVVSLQGASPPRRGRAGLDVSSATPERVLAPLGTRALPVTGRQQYGAYVVLTVADPSGPHPAAGQFYMLRSSRRWGGGEAERPFLPRAFSVLRARGEGASLELQFLLESVGPGTERLAELFPGDGLTLLGPLGRGFTAPSDGRRALLVGGGVGIAPLAIWQDQLNDADVLLGFRDAEHAAGSEVLSGARVATDDGSVGHHGLVTQLLEDELGGDARAEVYGCGPPPMLEAVRRVLEVRGVPGQLALESGMACGFGACFGCVVPSTRGYIRLCLEGPVLGADELTDETFAVPGMGHSG